MSSVNSKVCDNRTERQPKPPIRRTPACQCRRKALWIIPLGKTNGDPCKRTNSTERKAHVPYGQRATTDKPCKPIRVRAQEAHIFANHGLQTLNGAAKNMERSTTREQAHNPTPPARTARFHMLKGTRYRTRAFVTRPVKRFTF